MIDIDISKSKILKNVNKLSKTKNSKSILTESFKLFLIKRNNLFRKIFFFIIELGIAIIVARQSQTIEILKEIIEIINTIIIALIAIVFTGYAFFQALINDIMLLALLSQEENEQSKLLETNNYFAQVMMIQIVCLLINLLVITLMTILPEYWCLTYNKAIDEIIASILILFVLHLNVECIWEMKSFIFNIFQLFNLHAFSRVNEIINGKDDSDI